MLKEKRLKIVLLLDCIKFFFFFFTRFFLYTVTMEVFMLKNIVCLKGQLQLTRWKNRAKKKKGFLKIVTYHRIFPCINLQQLFPYYMGFTCFHLCLFQIPTIPGNDGFYGCVILEGLHVPGEEWQYAETMNTSCSPSDTSEVPDFC